MPVTKIKYFDKKTILKTAKRPHILRYARTRNSAVVVTYYNWGLTEYVVKVGNRAWRAKFTQQTIMDGNHEGVRGFQEFLWRYGESLQLHNGFEPILKLQYFYVVNINLIFFCNMMFAVLFKCSLTCYLIVLRACYYYARNTFFQQCSITIKNFHLKLMNTSVP